jgi:N-acetylneuraminic acid mutarotase
LKSLKHGFISRPTPFPKMHTSSPVRMLPLAALRVLLCCLAVLPLAGGASGRAAVDVFRPTGSTAAPHENHTATLLPNGKVLVTNADGPNFESSAEIYDPATGLWTQAARMIHARIENTATLLPNGKVLIAGGSIGGGSLDSAEVYDPANNTWTATGRLAAPVRLHTATLLANGKVLLTGGKGDAAAADSRVQLYDLATGTWTTTGSLNVARYSHSATLLANGRVLVAGGFKGLMSYGYTETGTAEVYDPATGVWSMVASLGQSRGGHAASLLPSGQVIVAGGSFANGGVSSTRYSAELFHPASGRWTSTGDPGDFPGGGTIFSTLLRDGRFFVAQGARALVFDPAAGTWGAGATLGTARINHTATLLPSGEVLVVGGRSTTGGTVLASAELFGPFQPSWVATGALISPRQHHTATVLPNGQVLAAGGNDSTSGTRVELYDPAIKAWMGTSNFTLLRDSHTATLLPTGKVLVVGGRTGSTQIKTAELYDPASGNWTATGSLAAARTSHTATLLGNGLVLVAGGAGPAALSSCELYDPATGRWTPTGSLSTARDGQSAVLLPSGKVLVAGGRDSAGVPLADAELYDPGTGMWLQTGALATARHTHTASLLANGQVLVTGGVGATTLASAELYAAATGQWASAGNLATGRSGHTATVLPNGRVAVVGGVGSGGSIASTELYDPSAGTWQAGANLAGARGYHTASLLSSGFLLVAGGYGPVAGGSDSLLNTAELFDFSRPLDPPGPQLASAAFQLQNGTALVLSGRNLLGSTVVVQLRNLTNGPMLTVHPADGAPPTSTGYSSAPIAGLERGFYLVTVTVDGVLSNSVILQSSGVTSTVLAQPATGVSPVSAVLHAQVAAYAGAATVAFAYSADPALLQNVTTTATAGTVTGGSIGDVSQTVSRLASATTYYFRAVVSTSGGVVNGDILAFRTADPIPTQATAPDATIAPTGGLAVAPSGSVLLPNGKVLLLSAQNVELYDPAAGASRSAPSMLMVHNTFTMALVPNGKVLVVGGGSTSNPYSAGSEVYDPVAATWSQAFTWVGYIPTLTVLADGKVLLAGGGWQQGAPTNTSKLYNPATGALTAGPAMNVPRSSHTATWLPGGKVLVAGGSYGSSPYKSAELYDPSSGVWNPTGNLVNPRTDHTAVLLPNGKVLAAGGFHGTGLASSELYDPASELWTATGDLAAPRYSHTATLLASGKVVVAGGENASGLLAAAELYEPATGTWTATGSLVTPRKFHTATALPNGQMVIAGGWDATGHAVGSTELYDPTSNTWRAVGDLVTPRANHGAALLPDGRILAAGGRDAAGLLAAAEVYDPATALWLPTRDLYEPRAFQTATALVSGKVLMADGMVAAQSRDSGLHASGEVYDPASGTWTTAGPLAQGRTGHTASLLPTGQVLLTGGDSGAGAGTAELYDAGLGFDPARQAQLLGTSAPFGSGRVLTLSGNPLLGPGGAGSGTSRDSFSYYPVVQLRHLATDRVQTLAPAAAPLTMPTSWTSLPASGLPLGYYSVTVFTNGVPSNSLVLQVESSEPMVTTNAATGVTAGGATLNAQVTANGLAGAVSFTYGTDPAVTQNVITTPAQAFPANASGAPVSQVISFLAAHRTYYYQAIATYSGTSVKGAIVPFTTENTAPLTLDGTTTAFTGNASTFPARYQQTDADGDLVNLVSASGPHLTVNGFSGNAITFMPDADFAGTTTLTFHVSDGTGLANGTASGMLTVTVLDDDAPDTSITSAPTGTIYSAAATIAFAGTDNVGVVSFQGRLDGAPFAPVTSPVNLTGLAAGAHTFDVRTVDAAGNTDAAPARASWTALAADNTPPTLALPADFAVEATSAAGAVVTYTAGATDAGSGVASSSFSPASGSQFALGTTVVQASAADAAGNTSAGSFRITVRDTSPPVIVIAGANPLRVPLNGTYFDPGATATDAVDGSVVVSVTGTVDVSTSGNYTVTYHATDSTGHSDTAKRTVTVGTGLPFAADDHYFSGSGKRTPLELHVLDNDAALHPALLTIASVTRPIYGSAVVAADARSITYTPSISYASFAGTEAFSYTVRDDFGATATARVTISNGAYREKGLYDGLLLSNAKVIGYLQVNLTGTGAFTGTLKVGSKSSVIRGHLDVDRHASVALLGASLDLQFDGEANIAATYVKGALTGQGTLSHATYNVASNPAPQEGTYTALLPLAPVSAGTAATASVVVNEFTHKVIGLQLESGGSGYLTPPMITILSPTGTGATAAAILADGAVSVLSVTNPGLRYPNTGALVLIDGPAEHLPGGPGYATMKVSQAGAVTLSGKLGDGTMLTASGWLKEDGSMALYTIVPYRPGPAGTLSGVFRFNEVQDVSDLDGELAWSKPRQTGPALYRNGFETTSHLIGSHYRRPAACEQALVFTNTLLGMLLSSRRKVTC